MSTELMSEFLQRLDASRLLDNDRIDELLRRPEPPQATLPAWKASSKEKAG